MIEESEYNWYGSAPGATRTISTTLVDARVKGVGPWSQTCEFVGTGESPDKSRKCKYFSKSYHRLCCIHFRDDLDIAGCDCRKG